MENFKNTPNIKVLMYHRVLDEKSSKFNHWHYVTVSEFRKQLKMIDRLGFTPITFLDYKLYTEEKLTLPAKPIILTFDDGYLDTFEKAIPVMLEMDMRAVIFVMGNRKLKRAHWDEKNDEDVCLLMSDEQIKMARNLEFEIGAHSLNHHALMELTDREVMHEIKFSKENIETILQEPIYTFAYPYGSVDRRVTRITSKSGFQFACGVYTGAPNFGESMFDVRRLAVNQHTTLMNFALKLLSPYEHMEWYYHYMKTKIKKLKQEPNGLSGNTARHMNGNGKSKNPDAIFEDLNNSKSL